MDSRTKRQMGMLLVFVAIAGPIFMVLHTSANEEYMAQCEPRYDRNSCELALERLEYDCREDATRHAYRHTSFHRDDYNECLNEEAASIHGVQVEQVAGRPLN